MDHFSDIDTATDADDSNDSADSGDMDDADDPGLDGDAGLRPRRQVIKKIHIRTVSTADDHNSCNDSANSDGSDSDESVGSASVLYDYGTSMHDVLEDDNHVHPAPIHDGNVSDAGEEGSVPNPTKATF
jgi:hypothetical protein